MNQQIYVSGLDGNSGSNATINRDGLVSFKSANNANVIFYNKSVLDTVKSREASRPVYVNKEYVRIQHPGEADVIDRPIVDDPRVIHIWPQQYQKFLNNQDHSIPDGTPLEILFPNRPEIPANLHTQGVHTVEQLAGLTAHASQMIGMGAVEWQNMAKKFLDSATGGVEHHRLVRKTEELQSQNEVLQNQIALMKTQLDRLTAAQMGISPMMIPTAGPNPAQQYNATLPQPQTQEEFVVEDTFRSPFDTETPKSPPTRANRKANS